MMPRYTIYNKNRAADDVEATGHFFSKEEFTFGYLVLVKNDNIVAVYKDYESLVIDQATLLKDVPLLQEPTP